MEDFEKHQIRNSNLKYFYIVTEDSYEIYFTSESDSYEILLFDKLIENNPMLAEALFRKNLSFIEGIIFTIKHLYKDINFNIHLDKKYINTILAKEGIDELQNYLKSNIAEYYLNSTIFKNMLVMMFLKK